MLTISDKQKVIGVLIFTFILLSAATAFLAYKYYTQQKIQELAKQLPPGTEEMATSFPNHGVSIRSFPGGEVDAVITGHLRYKYQKDNEYFAEIVVPKKNRSTVLIRVNLGLADSPVSEHTVSYEASSLRVLDKHTLTTTAQIFAKMDSAVGNTVSMTVLAQGDPTPPEPCDALCQYAFGNYNKYRDQNLKLVEFDRVEESVIEIGMVSAVRI